MANVHKRLSQGECGIKFFEIFRYKRITQITMFSFSLYEEENLITDFVVSVGHRINIKDNGKG